MTALLLVLTALLIALNAFFVMGEYALVRSRRSRLETMREEGLRGATLALHEIDEIGDYISTVQVGITMTWIGIDPDKVAEEGSTPEDLKALIAQSMGGGTLDPGEAGMLSGVFHLHEQE